MPNPDHNSEQKIDQICLAMSCVNKTDPGDWLCERHRGQGYDRLQDEAFDQIRSLKAEIVRLKSLMPPEHERGRGIVGEGSWAVFSEKVVAERDAALTRADTLQRSHDKIVARLVEYQAQFDALAARLAEAERDNKALSRELGAQRETSARCGVESIERIDAAESRAEALRSAVERAANDLACTCPNHSEACSLCVLRAALATPAQAVVWLEAAWARWLLEAQASEDNGFWMPDDMKTALNTRLAALPATPKETHS